MELVTRYLQQAYLPKAPNIQWPENLHYENKYRNDFWITREGECIYPYQMKDTHLINTIRMLHRSHPVLKRFAHEHKIDTFILYGKLGKYPHIKKCVKLSDNNRKYYNRFWNDFRIYMLMRQEVICRGLTEYIRE